jgi:phenylalanine-4-hydroxylase
MATLTVDLPADHPGFADALYRERRTAIAEVADRHRPGEAIPEVGYTDDEDRVWSVVSRELAQKHRRVACREYLDARDRLVLPTNRVPQLRDVDEQLDALTGFHLRPVPGLVPAQDFYAALADRTFLSTQYIRHHSAPFYTPEPDVVHEVIGHASMLASPMFASLYEKAGAASKRLRDPEAMAFFSRVFWFTLEFGVVQESGTLKVYGAGLLSSYGELDVFARATRRRFEITAMGTLDYDITRYQPVLFEAPSCAQLAVDLGRFFDDYSDLWCGDHLQGETR